jgi:hypothetical protein
MHGHVSCLRVGGREHDMSWPSTCTHDGILFLVLLLLQQVQQREAHVKGCMSVSPVDLACGVPW